MPLLRSSAIFAQQKPIDAVSLIATALLLIEKGAPVTVIPLIEDTKSQTKLMLQNPPCTKEFVRETDIVAGCTCDRWGHPCEGCVDHRIRIKTARPFSLPLDD